MSPTVWDSARRACSFWVYWREPSSAVVASRLPSRSVMSPRSVFDAVVAKCTRYGLFVDLPALAVGGMVHISKLADDFVRFDEFHETLAGGGNHPFQRFGLRLVFGDAVGFGGESRAPHFGQHIEVAVGLLIHQSPYPCDIFTGTPPLDIQLTNCYLHLI